MTIEEQLQTAPLPIARKTVIHLLLTGTWVSDGIAKALKPYDISMQQFNVLRILRGQKGKPANLSTINECMVTKMSNTTRLVDKLIGKGLVARKVCDENRRKVEIYITQEGLDFLQPVDQAVTEAEEQMVTGLTPETLEQLNTLLHTLRIK